MWPDLKLMWEQDHQRQRQHLSLRCVSILLLAIGMTLAGSAQVGRTWPGADKLFRSDPRWLGADGAFSVDLGHGRVLWLFDDTFVARKAGDARASAAFVHNTVAIQSGRDPSHASLKFYWRGNSNPSEVFPSKGQAWMWPSSGIRLGNKLLLFCTRVVRDDAKSSLGFKLVGWNAYWVADPDEEPTAWKLKAAAKSSDRVMMASATLRDDGFVYFFGESEPEHDLYVARLRAETLENGKFDALQWWSGSGWQTGPSERRPVLRGVGTEASVQRDPGGSGFLEINSDGFGATNIVLRRARSLEGPWSPPQTIYRPPESNAKDAFVYAGKSHPELEGADLIVTYAANGPDEKVAKDMSLYFPRFVRVELPARGQSQSPRESFRWVDHPSENRPTTPLKSILCGAHERICVLFYTRR